MSTRASRVALGPVAVLTAGLLWGSIGVLSVSLFRLGLSPWEVAFWRASLSAVAMAGFALIARPSLFRVPSGADVALLSAFGAVGVGLFYVSFQLATFLTSVAVAVVLLYTAPVFVVFGARLLLDEPLSAHKLRMMVVVVLGVWATALGAVGAEVRITAAGVAWGVAAALSYSAYYLFGKRYVPRYGVARTLLFSLVAGAVLLGVVVPLADRPPRLSLPAAAWGLLLLLALGTTLLANGLYYWGLARIEAGRAALLASIEPVVAALLALFLLEQRLTLVGWMGVGLVVAGVAGVPATRRTARGGTE